MAFCGYIMILTRRPIAHAGIFFLNLARTMPELPCVRVTLPQIALNFLLICSRWARQASWVVAERAYKRRHISCQHSMQHHPWRMHLVLSEGRSACVDSSCLF